MKTLILHPSDITTDFLKPIYEGREWTVINTDISKTKLINHIRKHDRIVFLGHGTWDGLMGYGRFVIDSTWVSFFKDKLCVYIWCNADIFVREHNLKGFYTGMIISDLAEAFMYGVDATQEDVNTSNSLFAEAICSSINQVDMVGAAKSIYDGDNPVIAYNKNNLFQYEGLKQY